MWADGKAGQRQVAQCVSAMGGQHGKYDKAVAELERFVYDTPLLLRGQAYDALRARFSENELLIARGMRDYAAVLSGCLSRHSGAIDATIAGHGHLDYDDLQKDIDWCTDSIYRLEDLVRNPLVAAGVTSGTVMLLRLLRDMKRDEQQRLLDFAASSAGIYDELAALAGALRRGMRYCGGMAWDGGGFVPAAGTDDLT